MEYGWVLWLTAMVVFGIAEAATVSMVSLWFIGGSLAALIAQLLGAGPVVQIIVFVAVSAALLACLRPFVKKVVEPNQTPTNVEALFGKQALVTEEVNALLGTGALKLDGKEWSVRSVSGEVIPVGTLVRVIDVEGVKLRVEPAAAAVQ